jgi:hypothetical protein
MDFESISLALKMRFEVTVVLILYSLAGKLQSQDHRGPSMQLRT